MIRYERRYWLLAGALAALSGYVDAIGFLEAGGLFVSFMSGNSTRLAVDLATGSRAAVVAGMLIGCFVAGATGGALIAAAAGRWRKPAVLATVALVLALASVLGQGAGAVAAMALAMGIANATFLRDGEVSVGVTYMTGTLVKLGHRLGGALRGGPRWAWVPYLLLWAGLVTGAIAGATAFAALGTAALWIAVALAAALAAGAVLLGPAG